MNMWVKRGGVHIRFLTTLVSFCSGFSLEDEKLESLQSEWLVISGVMVKVLGCFGCLRCSVGQRSFFSFM